MQCMQRGGEVEGFRFVILDLEACVPLGVV